MSTTAPSTPATVPADATPEPIAVTDAMRRAVIAEQCATAGHAFDVVTTFPTGAPAFVICQRCGRNWNIGDEAR